MASALVSAGLVQYVLPAWADGTEAGTSIRNSATANYIDPNAPNTPINATSNTVVVTVAEIAGITVTEAGTVFTATGDVDGSGTVTAGDEVYFLFTVTNAGNDSTQLNIPNLALVSGPALLTPTANLEVSEDGGNTWVAIAGAQVITAAKLPGESVQVRVPVTIKPEAVDNDIVSVKLGETPGDAQNQARVPDGGDVFTVDGVDGTPAEINGAPANGVREASKTQDLTVSEALTTYTLATILKVRSRYDNQSTPQITDDTITYGLSLRIENNDPTENAMTPAPLLGADLAVSGGTPALDDTHAYVLIADAIPAGTDLAEVGTPPTGWTVVYTSDPVSGAAGIDANASQWTATAPIDLSSVTRVGFVYDTTDRGAIAINELITGFRITLAVEAGATTPLPVANIAQLFGTSPTSAPVHDESGDQNPSNFGDSNSLSALPPGTTDTNGDNIPDPGSSLDPAGVDDGFINTPANPETGVDTAGNNTGATVGDPVDPSPGGEANIFVLDIPQAVAIANGPSNAPEAIGPSGQTIDDFSNRSVPLPAGSSVPGTTFEPQAVGFSNSIVNTGQTVGSIRLVPSTTLSDDTPATPADNPTADLSNLPVGTEVTLSFESISVTYVWDGTDFQLSTGTPLLIANVQPGDGINYGVVVKLPDNTPLSTDGTNPLDPSSAAIGGFAIPILAELDVGDTTDADTSNDPDGDPDAANSTINRIYTGYLRLVKESRILRGTGPEVATGEEQFSTTQKFPGTGNIIEYRITYANISEPQTGGGNIVLDAASVVITEDGTATPNNWALDQDNNGIIDTSNVPNSARDSRNGTITFTPGADQAGETATEDVIRYVDVVPGVVAPQTSGEFRFQRRVN